MRCGATEENRKLAERQMKKCGGRPTEASVIVGKTGIWWPDINGEDREARHRHLADSAGHSVIFPLKALNN